MKDGKRAILVERWKLTTIHPPTIINLRFKLPEFESGFCFLRLLCRLMNCRLDSLVVRVIIKKLTDHDYDIFSSTTRRLLFFSSSCLSFFKLNLNISLSSAPVWIDSRMQAENPDRRSNDKEEETWILFVGLNFFLTTVDRYFHCVPLYPTVLAVWFRVIGSSDSLALLLVLTYSFLYHHLLLLSNLLQRPESNRGKVLHRLEAWTTTFYRISLRSLCIYIPTLW